MKRLLTVAAFALCLACAAPVGAQTQQSGVWELTATWPGGFVTIRDANWLAGDARIGQATEGHGPYSLAERFIPDATYARRLGA